MAREPAALGETSTVVTVILAIELIVIPLWIVALSWLNRSTLSAILRKQVASYD